MAEYNFAGSNPITFKAGAAVPKYRMVKVGAAENEVIHTTAIADVALGVALETVASGEFVPVQILGIGKCVASAAVTLGDKLMLTATGAGKVSTSAGAANEVGIALQAATADGDVIMVALSVPNVERIANA